MKLKRAAVSVLLLLTGAAWLSGCTPKAAESSAAFAGSSDHFAAASSRAEASSAQSASEVSEAAKATISRAPAPVEKPTKLTGESSAEPSETEVQTDTEIQMDNDAAIAYGLLCEAEEVQHYISLGMSVQYTGETEAIDGRPCWTFVLGTEHDGQFVRELYYGVCDNLIYAYDAVSDTWSALG